jgi:pilus assembly protein FimV
LMPNDPRFKAQPENLQTAAEENTAETDDMVLDAEAAAQDQDSQPDTQDTASAIDFDISQYQADDAVTSEAGADETQEPSADTLSDMDDIRSSQLDEKVTADDIAPIQLDIDDNDHDIDWQAETEKQTSLDDAVEPISLDLDDDLETSVDSEAEAKAMQELDMGDAQDDLDFDFSGFDEVDEAETKLDLAAAYIDMDDPEGARSILQEVISEGSEAQKQRAQALLDTLN